MTTGGSTESNVRSFEAYLTIYLSIIIVRKFLNIDTEHNTQQSENAEARRR
jgi:hypothetical protein